MKIKLSNNENLEINSKVYVNGIGTYDGTNPVSGTNDLETVIESKQDTISDLGQIRSGASAGLTAYQLPDGGIPARDIAVGVIPNVSNFITNDVNNLTNYYKKTETYTKTEVDNKIGEAYDGCPFAEGVGDSSAEQWDNQANGEHSVATGYQTIAQGKYAHSEGTATFAGGQASHAEGAGTVTNSSFTVTGGAGSTSYTSSAAHGLKVGNVVGYGDVVAVVTAVGSTTTFTVDTTLSSSALSGKNIRLLTGVAYGQNSHIEGYKSFATNANSHAEGFGTISSGHSSHSEGRDTTASGNYSHSEGRLSAANGEASHAEGYNSQAKTNYSHAEGYSTTVDLGIASHAEGYLSSAYGEGSHAEGGSNNNSTGYNGGRAYGKSSHAEGYGTTTYGVGSHAEGARTVAVGNGAHSEGTGYWGFPSDAPVDNGTPFTISGSANATTYTVTYESDNPTRSIQKYYVISYMNKPAMVTSVTNNGATSTITTDKTLSSSAISNKTITVFKGNIAYGNYTHTEGVHTFAVANGSHAEGWLSYAIGDTSHVEGGRNEAHNQYEHGQGYLNFSHKHSDTWGDSLNTVHSVGIGGSENPVVRKNAIEIMQNGDIYVLGIGGYTGKESVAQLQSKTTLQDALESETVSDSEIDAIFDAAGLPTGSGSY